MVILDRFRHLCSKFANFGEPNDAECSFNHEESSYKQACRRSFTLSPVKALNKLSVIERFQFLSLFEFFHFTKIWK